MAKQRRATVHKPKGIHSTPRRRNRIWARHQLGQKAKDIAAAEGVDPAHVYGVVRRFDLQDWGVSRPGRGRPSALSDRDKRRILRLVAVNPFISVEQLRRDCCPFVSRSTVSRSLVKWGIKHPLAPTRPFLSEQAAARRYNWAREMREKPLSYWRRVLFSDESIIQRGKGRRRLFVFIPEGRHKLKRQYVQGQPKALLVKKMLWAAIQYGLKSNLVPLNGDPEARRGGVTARRYVEMLEEYLPILLNFNTLFMQDNAPIHTARVTSEHFESEGVEVIVWPAYSPDMNPIENLWHWLKDKLHGRHPELAELPETDESIETLIKLAEEVWESIPEELINNLIDSMPRRVEALYQARGWYTKY